jgi:hypothetical protein
MWKWVPDVNFLYYTVNYAVVDEINQMSYCSMPGTANMMVNGTEVIAEVRKTSSWPRSWANFSPF